MSQTVTASAQIGTINPKMGHMTTAEDVALYRAIGLDRGDILDLPRKKAPRKKATRRRTTRRTTRRRPTWTSKGRR
jgi:hypothetical protein